ncbi:MAG: hypothetical protein R3F39_14175 [Myxococcota bacterium]
MPAVIVGLEGRAADHAVAFWGVAAIRDGEVLINPTTGRRAPSSTLKQLVEDGHLTLLPKDIPVPSKCETPPEIVLVIRRAHDLATWLDIDQNRPIGQVASATQGQTQVRLFENLGAFDAYAGLVINKIINRVLGPSPPRDDIASAMLELGSVLDSSNPVLNAVRAHRAADPVMTRRFEARLRREEDRQRFQELFEVLGAEDAEHHLKYDGVLTEGGGMDLDQALQAFKSLDTANSEAVKEVRLLYPFVPEGTKPSPRLHTLKAASADFTFRAVEGQSTLERVVRTLTLRRIGAYLDGERPTEPSAARKVGDAIRAIVGLDAKTSVLHGTSAAHLVRVEPVGEDKAGDVQGDETHRLRVLGFVGGIYKRAKKADIHICAQARRYETVSTADDGEGEPPRGLTRGTALWQPAVLSVERRTTQAGVVWHAREVRLLMVGDTAMVDAFPSQVVPGAYLAGLMIKVQRRAATLETSLGSTSVELEPSQQAAEAWYAAHLSMCAKEELGLAGKLQPFDAVRPPEPPVCKEPERLLCAVAAVGGRRSMVSEKSVLGWLREHGPGGVARQSNNMLRPSRKAATRSWFVRGDAGEEIGLSDEGRARLWLFEQFGGKAP